jgi:hypothetical protein
MMRQVAVGIEAATAQIALCGPRRPHNRQNCNFDLKSKIAHGS